jgi:hypothetical protein
VSVCDKFENTSVHWRELWVHLGVCGSTGDKSGTTGDKPGCANDSSLRAPMTSLGAPATSHGAPQSGNAIFQGNFDFIFLSF